MKIDTVPVMDGFLSPGNFNGTLLQRWTGSLPTFPSITDHEEEFRDRYTLLNLIKSCGKYKDLQKAFRVHLAILKKESFQKDMSINNALINTYAKCGALMEAQKVFDKLPVRTVASWNVLITGYVHHGLAKEALHCFSEMQGEGFCPNAFTYACILKACSSIGALEVGEEIHAVIDKKGLIKHDVVLGTALVDMYAKCGSLDKAQEVFDELPTRDVVAWSALIHAYIQHGQGDEALNFFKKMRDEGISPDVITFVCMLKACGSIGSLEMGKEIHVEINEKGLLRKNVMLGTTLVDMYVKCGELKKAEEVFDQLPLRTIISWNTLITGYSMHGLGNEALECFRRMLDAGFCPDAVTFMAVLKACGNVHSFYMGKEIHKEIENRGMLENDFVLGTALVDMYAKIGVLTKAQEIFDNLPVKNLTSWTVLMAGYSQSGQAKTVLQLFDRMLEERIHPDLVVFVVLLTACSHAGLIEEGQTIFDEMNSFYYLSPTLEHYTCMVDLFSRAGHFERAIHLIAKVRSSDQLLLLLILLGACLKWLNVEIGRWTFEKSVQHDLKCAPAYICMANIYAAVGLHAEADRIETWRIENEAWKIPEYCGNVHPYIIDDLDR